MMNNIEYDSTKLKDVCKLITKGTTPTTVKGRFTSSGINFIKSESLTYDGHIDETKFAFIDQDTHQKLKRSQLHEDDILYSIAGINLGKCGIVRTSMLPANTNQAVAIIRVDSNFAYPFYVSYVLRNKIFVQNVLRGVAQSAQPNVNLTDLGLFKIPIPPLEEQKAIAHILGTLDDKIELNRRMNETLEAMAQAIFKSWFVDFDPVIDNALKAGNPIPDRLAEKAQRRQQAQTKFQSEGTPPSLPLNIANLFPNEFVETDDGVVPKGWEMGKISDLYLVKGGFAYKSKDFSETGHPLVRIKNIKNDRSVDLNDVVFIPENIAQKTIEFYLESGDIVMAMTGATIGKFGFIINANKKALLNQRVAKFIPNNSHEVKPWYLYCALLATDIVDYVIQTGYGSAQPNISTTEIGKAKLIIPTDQILGIYIDHVNPYLKKIINNQQANQNMGQIRDSLLPKILSGEIKVEESEDYIESCA